MMSDRHTTAPVQRPYEIAFHRPLRLAVTGVILAGATIAATAAILSLTHHTLARLAAFIVVALALIFVWRGVRWAVLVTLAGLAGQVLAVAGATAELAGGVADVKAHQLRQLGFDPTAGVMVNLIYSSIGFAVFGWFALRWRSASRIRP